MKGTHAHGELVANSLLVRSYRIGHDEAKKASLLTLYSVANVALVGFYPRNIGILIDRGCRWSARTLDLPTRESAAASELPAGDTGSVPHQSRNDSRVFRSQPIPCPWSPRSISTTQPLSGLQDAIQTAKPSTSGQRSRCQEATLEACFTTTPSRYPSVVRRRRHCTM